MWKLLLWMTIKEKQGCLKKLSLGMKQRVNVRGGVVICLKSPTSPPAAAGVID
jgi:hypothetical protein